MVYWSFTFVYEFMKGNDSHNLFASLDRKSIRVRELLLNPIALRMARTLWNPVALRMAKTLLRKEMASLRASNSFYN